VVARDRATSHHRLVITG